MKVYQITEERVDEKPTSGIANFGKKVLGKAPGAVGMSGTFGRMGGSAEVGSKANELYNPFARWQGINGKNDKNMTVLDLTAWANPRKVRCKKDYNARWYTPPTKLMDSMKKIVFCLDRR